MMKKDGSAININKTKYKGIQFKMKTSEGKGSCETISRMVMLLNPDVKDYSKYMKNIEPSKTWIKVKIPFTGSDGFVPTSWGMAGNMKAEEYLSKLSGIHFNMNQGVTEENIKGCYGQKWYIDDIMFYE